MSIKYTTIEQVTKAYKMEGLEYCGDKQILDEKVYDGMISLDFTDRAGKVVRKSFQANDYDLTNLVRVPDEKGYIIWKTEDMSDELNSVNLVSYGMDYCDDLLEALNIKLKEVEKKRLLAIKNRDPYKENIWAQRKLEVSQRIGKWEYMKKSLLENEKTIDEQ